MYSMNDSKYLTLVGTGQIGNGPLQNWQCPNRQYGQWAKGDGQWATAHSIFLYPYILYIPDFPISHRGCLIFFISPIYQDTPHRDIGDKGYSHVIHVFKCSAHCPLGSCSLPVAHWAIAHCPALGSLTRERLAGPLPKLMYLNTLYECRQRD